MNALNSAHTGQNLKDFKLKEEVEQKLEVIIKRADIQEPKDFHSKPAVKQDASEMLRPNLCQTMMSSVTSNLFKQNINQYTKAVPLNKNPNPY